MDVRLIGAHMITLDFETKQIVNGSQLSPIPVSVSLKTDDQLAQFISWGHPSKNNSSYQQAKDILEQIWHSTHAIIMHNAKFDMRVAMEHFGLPYLPVERVHDTMIMAYLHDPREKSFALKYLADKYLNMPPDEQQELKRYILLNVKSATEKTWGAHISEAPGNIVEAYADGDTTRTYKLYQYFLPYMSR